MLSNRTFAYLSAAAVAGVGVLLALRGPATALPAWADEHPVAAELATCASDTDSHLAHAPAWTENKAWRKQRAEDFLRESGRSIPNLYAAYCMADEDPTYLNALRTHCDDAAAAAIVATMTHNISDAEHWRDIDPDNICADLQCAWAKYQQGNSSSEGPDYPEILEDIFSASTKPQYELPRTSFEAALMEGLSYLGTDVREQWKTLPQYSPRSFPSLAALLPSIVSEQLPEDSPPARRAELADALWKIATTIEAGEDAPRVIEWEIAMTQTLTEPELLSVTGMRSNEFEIRAREFELAIPEEDRFRAALNIANEEDLQTARDVLLQHGDLSARRILLERVEPAEIERAMDANDAIHSREMAEPQ